MRWGEEGREEQRAGGGVFCFLIKGTWLVWNLSLSSGLSNCCCKLLLWQDLIKQEESFFFFIEVFAALSFVRGKVCSPCCKYLWQKEGKLLRLFSYGCKQKNKRESRHVSHIWKVFSLNLTDHPWWWLTRCLFCKFLLEQPQLIYFLEHQIGHGMIHWMLTSLCCNVDPVLL